MERPSHGSTDRSSRAYSRHESVGQSGRSGSRSGPTGGPAKRTSRSSRSGTLGTSKEPSGPMGKSGTAYQRSFSRIRNQRKKQRQAERDRQERAVYEMSHRGQGPPMGVYGQYVGPAGQFLVPEYSADGKLLGVQTGHYRSGSHAEGSSGSQGDRDTGHRAKIQRTGQGPTEPARGGMRGQSDEPPRRSPFTEVRGKRQQYDVVDTSGADGDDPKVQQCDPEDIDVPVTAGRRCAGRRSVSASDASRSHRWWSSHRRWSNHDSRSEEQIKVEKIQQEISKSRKSYDASDISHGERETGHPTWAVGTLSPGLGGVTLTCYDCMLVKTVHFVFCSLALFTLLCDVVGHKVLKSQ